MSLNPKVQAFVRRKIQQDYKTSSADLHAEATKMDPSLKKRSTLSFFASYVLPERRALNASGKGPARPKAKRGRRRGRLPKNASLTMTQMPESAPMSALPVHVPRAANGKTEAAQDMLRSMFIQIARDAMSVESRAEFADLLARIDRHAKDAAGILS